MEVTATASRESNDCPWPSAKLGEVALFRSGHRNSETAAKDGEFPFFVCSSEVMRSNDFNFDDEAIIMAGNNADGVFHLHHYFGKFAARQRTYVITPRTERLSCSWLFHQLGRLQPAFQAAAIGTTTRYVTIGMLRNAEIPLPPLPEQRAIAEALSDVDGLLGGLDRLIAKKRELKQAVMQQLLTCLPTGRPATRLSGFHGEWEKKSFGELFDFTGGYSASRDELSSAGHCYLHYGDIHTSNRTAVDVSADYADIPKLDVPLKRVSTGSLLEDGDVVFVDASEDDEGTSKHVVVENKEGRPFISGLHTIVAKAKTDELVHAYRRFCFQTKAIKEQFKFYAVGTKVSGISKSNIPKLTLPVPPKAEQTAIAEVLTEMDAELAALEQRREKTRALKQAMRQELLTGRIRLV